MSFNPVSGASSNALTQLPHGLTSEDIAALSHYPTIAKLFAAASSGELAALEVKLKSTFSALERVILRGSTDDSKQAKLAADAVKITTDFLEMLKQLQQGGKPI